MSNLSLSNVCINGRGNKTATLLDGNQRLVRTFDQPARCLFGPSTFNKDEGAARQGIPFELTQDFKLPRALDQARTNGIQERTPP